eukprot:TRINITY_DN2867_c0_g1_i1.p1 TRINITY_DN2867_c0_g1~~TRINITY_DN2867_c0_g1_i1.p1  ORF type:complete len:448 (+),score=57.97 TRINITY_DN2867_c0_g1_i1:94-1437(+)
MGFLRLILLHAALFHAILCCQHPSPKPQNSPTESMLIGTQCRLNNITTLQFASSNTIELEFSTPRMADVDGVLLCGLDEGFRFSRETVEVNSLYSSKDQFSPLATVPLGNVQWGLSVIEFGVIHDFLSNDEYYGTSFLYTRYDDLDIDSASIPISNLQRPINGAPNCFLITANLQRNSRYVLTITIMNPNRLPRQTQEIGFWYAPMTYTFENDYILFHVRGHKQGTVCQPQEGLNIRLGANICYPKIYPECELPYKRSSKGDCILCASASSMCCPTETHFVNPTGLLGCVERNDHHDSTALCDYYSVLYENYLTGYISDSEAMHAILPAFKYQSLPLIDTYSFIKGEYAFITNIDYNMDGRRPESPTRWHGIRPNCNEESCQGGSFVNARDGRTVPLVDGWFQSSVNFRFIGQLLYDTLKQKCPKLYDPSDPKSRIGKPIPNDKEWP